MVRRALVVAALVAPLALVGAAGTAAAQSDCDALAADETGEIDLAAIETAAEALRAAGPEPRVRAISDAGGNIDVWAADEVARCPSWQGPDGGTRTNLVVVAVSLDRQSGIFFGDQWAEELGEVWPSIRADAMNPRFQDGDLTGGLVAGVDAVRAAVTAPDGVTTTPVPDGGGDGSSGSASGWIVVGLSGAGAAGFAGYELMRRRRRHADAAEAADAAELDVSRRFLELQERWETSSIRAEVLIDDAAPGEYPALELRLAELASGLGRVGTGITDAPVSPGTNKADEAKARRAHYDELGEVLDEVGTLFDDLDAVVAVEMSEKQRLADQLDSFPDRILALRRSTDAAVADGWIVEWALTETERAKDRAAEAGKLVAERRFDTAEEPAAQATAAAEAAHRWLDQRAELAAQVHLDHAELSAHRADLVDDLDRARRVLADLDADYPLRAFADHADLITWGERQLSRYDELLAAAARLGNPSHQRFEQALSRLSDAERVAASFSGRIGALDQLDHDLREAERTAPQAVNAARTSVGSAERFVTAHLEDLPGWPARLAPITDDLRHAVEEAKRLDVDWLAVLRGAEHAQVEAAQLRAEAATRVDEVRAARRRIAELETELTARADALERYLARHHGDVRSGVDAVVTTTRAALAERDDDPVERVARLDDAAAALTQAEDAADADAAEAQRRRQRRGGVILVGGGWPGGFGGGGFGGGGFGGGGFGGGGFGGGGFGGGGLGGGGGSW